MRTIKPLPLAFFQRDAESVARDLLGKIIAVAAIPTSASRSPLPPRRARIVETEAYVGSHDLACHGARGLTPRTQVMFGPGGHTYVYFIYGMYHMLNFVTGHAGDPQGVLIRAAEPLDFWRADLSGPGKLARAFALTRADNALPLTGPRITLWDDFTSPQSVRTSPRIGVDYAGEWRHKHLRFFLSDSPHVSAKRGSVTSRRRLPR